MKVDRSYSKSVSKNMVLEDAMKGSKSLTMKSRRMKKIIVVEQKENIKVVDVEDR